MNNVRKLGLSTVQSVANRDQGFLLLAFLLPGLYICDVLYGIANIFEINLVITPGQIARGGALFTSFCLAVYYRHFLPRAYFWLLVAMVINVAIGSFVAGIFPANLPFDIVAATKVVYGPTVVVLFYLIYLRFNTSMQQVFFFLEVVFYLLGISLLVMHVFEIGRETYGTYAFGYKGVYHSQNDIGLTSMLVLCVAFYRFYVRTNLTRFILLSCGMAGLVGMGTRTGMVAPLMVSFAVAIAIIYSLIRSGGARDDVRRAMWLIPLTVMMGASASYMAYKAAVPDSNNAKPTQNYQSMKIEETISGNVLRGTLLQAGRRYVESRSALKDVLGEGAYSFRRGVASYMTKVGGKELKDVEMDWFDLYGQYGIVFVVLMHLFYLYFLIQATLLFLRQGRLEWGIVALMLGLFLSHSLFAGHAMVSPVIGTPIAAVIALLLVRRDEKEA